MREIKFRAWNKYPNGDKEAKPVMCFNAQNWAGFGELCKSDNNLILMQYTGLKDKEGTEIYEGDVVRYNGNNWSIVYMHPSKDGKSSAGYYVVCGETTFYCFCETMKNIKVIGNIYQNPELLKGE